MRLPYIEAGEIVTTHGVRGEVKVLPWLDGPEDLHRYRRCRIRGTEYKIEKCRTQKNCCLVKLGGVDTVEDAQVLRGQTVEVFRQDAPEGTVFAGELEGMEVYCGDARIGTLTEVLDYPGNRVYAVTGEKEYLIPAVKEFILQIDLENNRMDVKLLEGMAADEN